MAINDYSQPIQGHHGEVMKLSVKWEGHKEEGTKVPNTLTDNLLCAVVK